jgi:hypothetical protein
MIDSFTCFESVLRFELYPDVADSSRREIYYLRLPKVFFAKIYLRIVSEHIELGNLGLGLFFLGLPYHSAKNLAFFIRLLLIRGLIFTCDVEERLLRQKAY